MIFFCFKVEQEATSENVMKQLREEEKHQSQLMSNMPKNVPITTLQPKVKRKQDDDQKKADNEPIEKKQKLEK